MFSSLAPFGHPRIDLAALLYSMRASSTPDRRQCRHCRQPAPCEILEPFAVPVAISWAGKSGIALAPVDNFVKRFGA